MRLEVIANKSIAVIGTLVHEHEIVTSFRQFRVDEMVSHSGEIWQIVDCDTYVESVGLTCHNWYTLKRDNQPSRAVCEIDLLRDNPRAAPDNIFDALADSLPRPHFVAGGWQAGNVLAHYLKQMNLGIE